MTRLTTAPPMAVVGRRAATLADRITGSDEARHLEATIRSHPEHWTTIAGIAVVARLNVSTDTGPLFREAIRLLALTAAAHELTGEPATVCGSAPVEAMTRAVLAQHTMCRRLTQRLDITLIEPAGNAAYRPGDDTHRSYLAAGWGEPDPRYWLDVDETSRRIATLHQLLAGIGVHAGGRRHDLRFHPQLAAGLVGI